MMGMTGERMGGEQGGEPEIIGVGNLLLVVNDALRHTSVLLQVLFFFLIFLTLSA